MQGLKLPTPPLLAERNLPPAHEQSQSSPSPEPVHHFLTQRIPLDRPEERKLQAWVLFVGLQVLCSVAFASLTTTASTSSTPTPVFQALSFQTYGMHYLYIGSTAGGGSGNLYIGANINALINMFRLKRMMKSLHHFNNKPF